MSTSDPKEQGDATAAGGPSGPPPATRSDAPSAAATTSTPPSSVGGSGREDERVKVRERIRAHAAEEAVIQRIQKAILLDNIRKHGVQEGEEIVLRLGPEVFDDKLIDGFSVSIEKAKDGVCTATLISNEKHTRMIREHDEMEEQDRKAVEKQIEWERTAFDPQNPTISKRLRRQLEALKAAKGGAEATVGADVGAILGSVKELAAQGADAKTLTQEEVDANQAHIDDSVEGIARLAKRTSFARGGNLGEHMR